MRYEDTVLLQKWAKICWHISVERTAREPHKYADGAEHRGMLEYVREDQITTSKGYKDLHRKFLRLSPGARRNFRKWLATQVQLVEALKRKVEKEGGVFSYADLTFDVRAADDGNPIGGTVDPTPNQEDKEQP